MDDIDVCFVLLKGLLMAQGARLRVGSMSGNEHFLWNQLLRPLQ